MPQFNLQGETYHETFNQYAFCAYHIVCDDCEGIFIDSITANKCAFCGSDNISYAECFVCKACGEASEDPEQAWMCCQTTQHY